MQLSLENHGKSTGLTHVGACRDIWLMPPISVCRTFSNGQCRDIDSGLVLALSDLVSRTDEKVARQKEIRELSK
jgi:hypothetical protein